MLKAKVTVEIHWQTVIDEINKNPALLKSQIWRLEHLYLIVTKKGKRIPFKLNRAQRHFLEHRKFKNIILKSRQLGFTTLITLLNTDNILFNKNTEALSIAHTKDGMTDIFDRKVRYAIDNMHPDIKGMWGFNQNSKTKIQIKHRDSSVSAFSVSLTGRGGTFQYVHISEYAKMCKLFPERAQRLAEDTFPAVPMDGNIDIEGTAEGAQGGFYEMWIEAQNSLVFYNDSLARVQFFPHFYNWTWDDEELNTVTEIIPIEKMEVNKDIDWFMYQTEHGLSDREMTYYYMKWVYLKKNIEKLHQEYPTTWEEAFIASGSPYFNARRISEMMLKVKDFVAYDVIGDAIVEEHGGPLMVYERPDKKLHYVLGGDTAEGLSTGDASTMGVVCVETQDVVAIYKNQIEPHEFSMAVYQVGKWYNKALVAVEANKDGYWVNDNLQRMGYENLYFREFIDDITKNINKYFGWRTDKKTRDPMLTELKTQVNKREFPYLPFLTEAMTFIRNSRGRPEAVSGKHDDVVMCLAIAYEVLKQRFSANGTSIDAPPKSLMETIFGN